MLHDDFIRAFDHTKKYRQKYIKKLTGAARKKTRYKLDKIEMKLFGRDFHTRNLKGRSNFSVFKSRRSNASKKYQKAYILRKQEVKRALGKVLKKPFNFLPPSIQKGLKRVANTKLGRGFKYVHKSISTVSKITINSIKAVVRSVSLIFGSFIPIFFLVMVILMAVAALSQNNNFKALSAKVNIQNGVAHYVVTENKSVIMNGRARASSDYSFSHRFVSGDKEIYYIKGVRKNDEYWLTGKYEGKDFALKSKFSSGKLVLSGLLGNGAELALQGEWLNPYSNVSYTITSLFGYRHDPFTHEPRYHSGMDLVAHGDKTVHAAATGVVSLAGSYGGYGNCVIIDHGKGEQSLYGHLSQILVSNGQSVTVGQPIGIEGSTGRSTGSHLHFEYRVNGEQKDPALKVLDIYMQKQQIQKQKMIKN